ncbi:B-cell CLL/lymphoma 9 protein isoform X1 [Mustela erminea]|uniref:B-cell CLL/lymphoma 9 protein isoform X1 n=2 Tax=Mustela erminea TaxID=36723 RepID=UPI0013872323|nr:B-cell CLL/lymphoma 9 protein isoform X1 [Mustela erminea]XP_032217225.1 B-cell CLL/lymphoma 9 protein isoform X1 [Mustela erminea]XP_032217226.1 B-cell CLL/lymphoma 9 protein isoform X1 [Mustela erminea]XP_032217227.1 B-cell CLL/lymphoma 9 protein isoform X1 [Mustela erminea]XP_032217228.1 B-cell CLL/lymphoma 9 protein isoform X1 [Mustela erminea]XP_032217229.1 B-cell CLL/lymphoma 9 protein isoform X1 [Mustela erminea]XP_032217230.1 B-cell CLL/lymphoma 9 protein isoform X1 [Mustela ermine
MHSSNPKVRNSPSGNTQSSPKSKQEVMVRPPTVMSPSGNPQLDSKFSNQGKQGGSASQSQPSPCDSKSGGHTPKALPGPGGSMGLKNGAGNGAKGKGKRERSISADSFDQRDPGTPNDDSDIKECNSADHIKSQDSQHTPHSMTPSNAAAPRSSTPSHGQTTAPEPTPAQKTPAKVVYVFSTEMANKAAEAVLKGQVETIVSFHIQNISNSKTERSTAPLNTQLSAIRNDPKPLPQQPPAPANQDQNSSQNTRLQPTPPIPAPAPKPAAPPRPLDRDSPGVDNKLIPSVGSPASSTPLPPDGSGPNSTPNNRAVTPVSQGSNSSSADPKAPPPPPVSSGEPPTLGENPDGLSQEQLEHRERSLQTLRDIQRMLFPDEKEFTGGQSGGPQQNPGVLDGPQKKPEGPIQAMMAQSQSLGKGPGPRTDVGAPFGPQGHRDVPFSPDEMVPPSMNSQSGPMGPEHLDHMTPEQIAWLKLQQEFYEEKRRKQEQVVVQQCSLQDMMVHQHGPRGVVRGPPPPYQMAPSEGWGPGGAEPFADGLNMPHSLPPRGMAPHPNMPGSQMRLPGFAGMINSEMEGPNVPNPASRPGLSGVSWPDDVPKIADGRNFPPGQGVFSGPGRGERFPNPQGLSEEMFQQQLAEKQLALPPGMSMETIRPSMEMNRMIPGAQRHMEPGNNPIFPRIPVEGPLSPSRGDFPKGMPPQMGPGRELEFGMVPSGMKGDVSLNVNMGSNPQMIPQKMREAGAGPEEMMKLRPGGADMLPAQQKMVPLPFGEHPQQEYGMGPRPFLPMSQGPGSNSGLRNLREPIGPDQRTNSRLSHMPPLPLNPSSNPASLNTAPPVQRGLGRKPLDISVAGSQVHSPGINPLKSPTMRQVQSPMLGSPSGNLKSPQTPSQLAGMLAGPAAAASIKSPPVLGSAAASPVHLKSPSLPAPSPGWTSSPKPPLQSPGIPPNHKAPLTMASPAMLGSVESGGPPPPTASQSASVNIPGSLPSSTPYTMPPEPTLSQNPLSIMMSRMSKFAMPSSTPLYHDAIKTVASSDDDSPPARSPNLPSMNNMPGMGINTQNPRISGPNPVVPMPTLSPMGMTQPLSHSNQMPSPNAMGPNIPPHGVPMGPGLMSHNPIMGHGSQEPPMVPQGRMGFPQGFPPVQSPPQQVPFPHNGPSGGQGNFPGGMGFPGEGPLGRPSTLPQSSADAALCKPGGPGGPDSFAVLGNSMPSVFTDPDLQEVIRPGATGIPEFDLSRIIPSEKPSQTLQYFPRGEVPGRKQPQGPGPGFSHMQGMMGEQAPRMGLALPGMGGPGPVGTPDIPLGTAPSMPGHNPMRPPAFLQQGMMGPHHRMMSPAQSTMPGQPTLMSNPAAAVGMIPGKDRGPAGLYTHPGPVGSPGMMMSMQGMMGPQQNIMIPPQMRPRGMAADVGMGGFSQGPGNPGNMMF